MENSMEVSQKTKNRTTILIQQIPLLGIYPEKTLIQKDTCAQVFTAALFTIGEMEAA